MAEHRKASPQFSACGLNCGLCPRFYTEGSSRCPGCGGTDFSFKHPSCGVLSCASKRALPYCYLCEEYPCKKYEKAALDSFITHRHIFTDPERAKAMGIETYLRELDEKMALLQRLLQEYDDGRRKSFFCLAVNLLPLEDVRAVLAESEASFDGTPEMRKGRAQSIAGLFHAAAKKRGIVLQLMKK